MPRFLELALVVDHEHFAVPATNVAFVDHLYPRMVDVANHFVPTIGQAGLEVDLSDHLFLVLEALDEKPKHQKGADDSTHTDAYSRESHGFHVFLHTVVVLLFYINQFFYKTFVSKYAII